MKKLTADAEYRNEYHRARRNILYTAIRIEELDRKFMSQFDLTPQQHNIMRIVFSSPERLNVLQIRKRMFEKQSDASRLIDRLYSKGFLKKEKSKADKRLVEIYLTDKGIELLKRINLTLHLVDKPLFGLTEKEATQICELLTKIRVTGIDKHEAYND